MTIGAKFMCDLFYVFRIFRINLQKSFAQPNDVFAEDAILETSEGPIDATRIRERIYSGILEGTYFRLPKYFNYLLLQSRSIVTSCPFTKE